MGEELIGNDVLQVYKIRHGAIYIVVDPCWVVDYFVSFSIDTTSLDRKRLKLSQLNIVIDSKF